MAVIERNDRTNVPGHAELIDREPAGGAPSAPIGASAGGDRTTARAIGVIAFLVAGAALWAGQKFMIPLVSGIMLAMLVAPVVAGLVRIIRLEFLSVV